MSENESSADRRETRLGSELARTVGVKAGAPSRRGGGRTVECGSGLGYPASSAGQSRFP
jgi:hypothetical protein